MPMRIAPAEPATEFGTPRAVSVSVTDDTLSVELSDGRTLALPSSWYPRLSHATPSERANWRLIGNGSGIHWPDIEEDLSVAGLIAGRPSQESSRSLNCWLAARPGPNRT